MGVPSFYRWLINKYPKVVVNAIEEEMKGESLSLDTSSRNPNGFEFDNLYLDMNGIIHPCFHPEEDIYIPPPKTFEDVFDNIFKFIDRIISIVRPRKLLYMAIDGVAPRAKMNQQRARRFRTAKDKEIAEEEESLVKKEFEREAKMVLPKEESEISDSNIITPGTVFMDKLSKALKRYISSRLSNDSGWKSIKVILSDANVPGEGEHKIMSFIRNQRVLPSYDPNTRHCLHGLDADLIMLALATHELHFSILREDMLVQEKNTPSYKLVPEPSSPNSKGWFKNVLNEEEKKESFNNRKPYQFVHVWILREYLELDMQISDRPENFTFDIERIVDDFVFMCFFVGNDFLPHTPSLEIHEGALDLLMTVYKKELKNLGGYMIDMTRVNEKNASYIKLSRVEKFLLLVGTDEEKIFTKRSKLRERKLRQIAVDNVHEDDNGSSNVIIPSSQREVDPPKGSPIIYSEETISSTGDKNNNYLRLLKNTKDLKEKVKANIRRKSDLFKNGGFAIDKVRLGSPGYKERYYREKFSAENPAEIESMRKIIVEKYTEGLLWVLLYYYSGTPSWKWHYPFHYGPFASDMKGLSQVKVRFKKDLPFKPFDQLLSVLPSRSSNALPKAYQALMKDDSPIMDFYPADFEIDMDGKRFSWQGVSKLPFIDEERLLTETRRLEKDLEVDEREINSEKLDQLFVLCTHKLGSQILSQNKVKTGDSLTVSEEICGLVRLSHEHTSVDDSVLCVLYQLLDGSPHVPRLNAGVQSPEKTVREDDFEKTQLWHEYPGMKPFNKYTNLQERFRNASIDGNSSLNNTRDPSGHGWGAGRGRGRSSHITGYETSFHRGASQRQINDDNWRSRSHHQSYDQTVHKCSGSGRSGRGKLSGDHYSGTRNYTSQNPNYDRAENSNFWPSRNNFAHYHGSSGRGQEGSDIRDEKWKQNSTDQEGNYGTNQWRGRGRGRGTSGFREQF